MRRAFLAAAAAAVLVPAAAHAQQTWHTLEVSRQLRDTSELRVHVQYGAGRFDLRAATTPVLYAMDLVYDDAHASPLHRFDAAAGTLEIGLKDVNMGWTDRPSDDDGKSRMNLALAPTVPMDLSLSLGATQANIDLGGLTLRGLHVETGAADESLDFSAPNRARLGTVTVDVGAASFRARRLANMNATALHVNGGVGAVDLGFGGAWTGDLDATVKVTLGKVTLHIPRDVGVRLALQRFLTSFDNDGLVERDGYYYSDNWDSAKHHLRVLVQTSLGNITIDRSLPATP
ncbi:MAG: hypothetical protein KGL38_11815 [Gemmatimonadota bacterium]|nr:hypothetical protein [Gemmatimonadota bacterium]MDE3128687.1 hypothetical protein [Gemmatimonadota bacterium]MDE3171890.1 hypothetical protein [Gemmatimonadota bacterium]MDE3215331.1 hypothetical protein [Gemmatimonadota bacterium]